MKRLRHLPTIAESAFALVLIVTFGPLEARAAEAGAEDAARRAKVAFSIGKRAVTVGDVEDRMATLSAAQQSSFGDTAAARAKKFVEEVLVPEVLLAEGAFAKKLDSELPYSQALARARANGTLRALRREFGTAASIPMEDVKRYYEANRGSFDAPERYAVWRILVKTRVEGEALLAEVKKEPTPERWRAFARDKSLDKATHLRGGNLGFLTLDGNSNEPGVRVAPEVVKAAASVKDGELVARPVAEGENFAVVWRRGTLPPARQSVEDAAAQIRDTLFKKRMDDSEKQKTAELRASALRDMNEALVNTIEISLPDGGVVPRKRPGQVPPLAPPK